MFCVVIGILWCRKSPQLSKVFVGTLCCFVGGNCEGARLCVYLSPLVGLPNLLVLNCQKEQQRHIFCAAFVWVVLGKQFLAFLVRGGGSHSYPRCVGGQ